MSAYTYSRLLTPATIRLFDLDPGSGPEDIRGTLRDVELPDDDHYAAVPEYTALSYTWGSPLAQQSNIWISGRPLKVRPNLLAALHAVRDPEEVTTLWIDALCINQHDVYERNNQVVLMAKIYRLADQVEIWLGHADEDVRAAFGWIRNNGVHVGDQTAIINAPLDAINAMLARDYWSRVWIVQEVQLAQHILLRSDDQRIMWNDFSRSCLLLQNSLTRSSNALHLIDQRIKIVRDPRSMFDRTLETLIRTYQDCDCTDPRDHIFGFLSLASDCAFGTGLRAEYGISRLEVLAKTLEFCQPTDAQSFGSILFHALAEQEDDRQWKDAASTWDAVLFGQQSLEQSQDKVQVLHFVVVASSTTDWARHGLYHAYRRERHHQRDNEQQGGLEGPLRSEGPVRRLDRWNIYLCINGYQYVVVSTDQTKAVSNVCASLDLHDGASGCIRGYCSTLQARQY